MREFFDVRSFRLSGKTGLNVCYGIANGTVVCTAVVIVKLKSRRLGKRSARKPAVSSLGWRLANGMGAGAGRGNASSSVRYPHAS